MIPNAIFLLFIDAEKATDEIHTALMKYVDATMQTLGGTIDDIIMADIYDAKKNLESTIDHSLRILCTLSEKLGTSTITSELTEMRKNLEENSDSSLDNEGNINLPIYWKIRSILALLKTNSGLDGRFPDQALVNILKNSARIVKNANIQITKESEIRNEILKIIEYSFPDAVKEQPIPKATKSYKADIAIPSLQTLVEIKYIRQEKDLPKALDEVFADMHGYHSLEYTKFFAVLFMTSPFFTEGQINAHLQRCESFKNWTPILVNHKTD